MGLLYLYLFTIKKVNVYLSSLMMKVLDHVYVLGLTYKCHTYCCYAYRLYFLTCYMYKSSLRHTHDPVLSSLKMKGIRLLFYLFSPTPSTTRSHTCACVTRMKDNASRSFKPRHVIPDTRISSGQCPRCDVNVTLGARDLHAVRKMCARFPRSHKISGA
jgi:hypothetical protein